MKPDELYQALKDLAQQLNIDVSEQNFKPTGVPVQSGVCKVRGQTRIIIDKNKGLANRLEFLAQSLAGFALGDLFILPAVRDCLDQCSQRPSDLSNSDLGAETELDQEPDVARDSDHPQTTDPIDVP